MVRERRPDLVIVSGDLTQRAKREQFEQAREFVDRMPVPTITVPGNHDVPMYRFWERIFAPYGSYRKYFSEELEPVYRDEELLAVGVNTAHGWTIEGGRVRRKRLNEVREILENTPSGLFKIVVAHHHLIPPPRFERQAVSRNAYEAIDVFSSAGVDLILSGHKHQSYIGNSEEFYPKGRPPVVIVHSGTTTSNRGRGSEKDKNTCCWIELEGELIRVSQLRWDPGLERFAEHNRHWYPRQERKPYTLEGLAIPPFDSFSASP